MALAALADIEFMPESSIVDLAEALPDPDQRLAWVRLMEPDQLDQYRARVRAGGIDSSLVNVNNYVPQKEPVVPMRKIRRSVGWLVGRKWQASGVTGMDVVENDEADIRAGRVAEITYEKPERAAEAPRWHLARRAVGALAVGVLLVSSSIAMSRTLGEAGRFRQNAENVIINATGMNQEEPPFPKGLNAHNPFGPEPPDVRRRPVERFGSN
jgi:hypothetical protein